MKWQHRPHGWAVRFSESIFENEIELTMLRYRSIMMIE